MIKASVAVLMVAMAFVGMTGKAMASASMECAIGPQERVFGNSKWLLYGCKGGKAAVLVSAEGNPAMPFYFFVFREGERYRITGEGTGNKQASAAAYKELEALSDAATADLLLAASKPRR